MEEELISKKDILEVTGISYGQLYRWKRKNLLPEDWFIKKSSYTGQETYFPKKKIIERINKIIQLKDTMSLDELADIFSDKADLKAVNGEALIACGFIRKEVLSIYENLMGKREIYGSKELLLMYILQEQIDLGKLTIEEIQIMMNIVNREYDRLVNGDGTLYMIRKRGVAVCIAAFKESIIVDESSDVISVVNLKEILNKIKFKMQYKD